MQDFITNVDTKSTDASSNVAPRHQLLPEYVKYYQDRCVAANDEWTDADDRLLVSSVDRVGSQWDTISTLFPGKPTTDVVSRYVFIMVPVLRTLRGDSRNGLLDLLLLQMRYLNRSASERFPPSQNCSPAKRKFGGAGTPPRSLSARGVVDQDEDDEDAEDEEEEEQRKPKSRKVAGGVSGRGTAANGKPSIVPPPSSLSKLPHTLPALDIALPPRPTSPGHTAPSYVTPTTSATASPPPPVTEGTGPTPAPQPATVPPTAAAEPTNGNSRGSSGRSRKHTSKYQEFLEKKTGASPSKPR